MHRLLLLTALLAAPAAAQEEPSCPEGTVLVPGSEAKGGPKPLCWERTEVTGAAYKDCVHSRACTPAVPTAHLPGADGIELEFLGRYCNADRTDRLTHPVNCIDWNQANAYCASLGRRLPTAEEFRWAAKGRDEGRAYPWGDDAPDETLLNACGAECAAVKRKGAPAPKPLFKAADGNPGTAPVGTYQAGASRDGLLDLAGNVAEWTMSRPDGNHALVVGGGFMAGEPSRVKADASTSILVVARLWDVGLRCVAEPGADAAIPKRRTTSEASARQACAMRAELIFVTKCRQACQIEAKGRNPERTEACLNECGKQAAMTQFLNDCVTQAGYGGKK